MKKTVIISMFVAIAAFVGGMEFNSWYYNIDQLYDANEYKRVLLEVEDKTLEEADSLIDKHNLYDADGSDLMDNYMRNMNKVDSLNALEL